MRTQEFVEDVGVKRARSFEQVYRQNLPSLVAFASRRVGAHDAIEVVAQTFTIAWRRFDDVPAGAEARLWLFGTARRVMANERRSSSRRSALHDRLRAEWKPSDETEQRTEARVAHLDVLARALHELSAEDRELLLLAGLEELKPAEIAIVLDVTSDVVRNRLSRARRRLQKLYETHALREQEDA